MTNKNTLCVVIPTYNRPEFLRRALNSVVHQTVKADEIIVVDNGQNRVTLDPEFNNIRIIKAPVRAGVSQARNIGLSLASSEFVAFLDDDDYWDPKYLEKVKKTIINSKPKTLIIAALHDSKTHKIIKGKNEELDQSLTSLIRKNPGIVGSNLSARRSEILELGAYDITLSASEDIDLAIQAKKHGYTLKRVEDAISFYDASHPQNRLSNIGNLITGKKRLIHKHVKNRLTRITLAADYMTRLILANIIK